MQLAQQGSRSTSTQHFSRQENVIQDLQSKVDDLQNLQRQDEASVRQMLSQQEEALHEPLAHLLGFQKKMDLRLGVIEAATVARAAQHIARPMRRSSSSASSPYTGHSIRISTLFGSRRCSNSCTCACHVRSFATAPRYLRGLFGALFIGYTGVPRITPACDVKSCVQRSSLIITAAYFFPTWLLARAVFIAVSLSSCDGPQFSLRAPRLVDGNSAIFGSCYRGDVDGVRHLLSQRLSSPFDVSISSGDTALMVSGVLV